MYSAVVFGLRCPGRNWTPHPGVICSPLDQRGMGTRVETRLTHLYAIPRLLQIRIVSVDQCEVEEVRSWLAPHAAQRWVWTSPTYLQFGSFVPTYDFMFLQTCFNVVITRYQSHKSHVKLFLEFTSFVKYMTKMLVFSFGLDKSSCFTPISLWNLYCIFTNE